MASFVTTRFIASASAVILFAIIYQNFLHELLFSTFGIARRIQPISDFSYSCQQLTHEHLEACEDLWLDPSSRQLYLACTGSHSRSHWNPGGNKFNTSGRRPSGAVISVLDIDKPGADGLYGLHQLKTVGYQGARGDGTLDTVGFDVEVMDDGTLRFWMVNMQPPGNDEEKSLDATKVGANATIELFELRQDQSQLVHVKTFYHEAVFTPNRPAATRDGGFLVTNDHSTKAGLRRELDPILGGGNVAYCNFTSCHIAADQGFVFPNGMVRGADGLYYVPNIFRDKIMVMELGPDLMLTEVAGISVGMPIDNLSVDQNGDIWATGFPKALEIIAMLEDPFTKNSRSTIWRIRKVDSGYLVQKMLEDRDAVALSGATTTVHDVKTGRLYIGGAATPYITICNIIYSL